MKYLWTFSRLKCIKKIDLQNHKEDEPHNRCNIREFKTFKVEAFQDHLKKAYPIRQPPEQEVIAVFMILNPKTKAV